MAAIDIDLVGVDPGPAQCQVHQGSDRLDVSPRRDLGHDAPEPSVRLGLRRQHGGSQLGPLHDADGRLVAARLDAEDDRITHAAASSERRMLIEALGVFVCVDVDGPHDEGIFVLVVVLAQTDGSEPEALIEGLGRRVGHADFERQVFGAPLQRDIDQFEHQAGTEAAAPDARDPRRVSSRGHPPRRSSSPAYPTTASPSAATM